MSNVTQTGFNREETRAIRVLKLNCILNFSGKFTSFKKFRASFWENPISRNGCKFTNHLDNYSLALLCT